MLKSLHVSALEKVTKPIVLKCLLTVISLTWSPNLKYLGITLKSFSKFSVDLKDSRSNFYKSFNAIYSKVSRASEDVILSLMKSFCIPSLLYGIEALYLSASDKFS